MQRERTSNIAHNQLPKNAMKLKTRSEHSLRVRVDVAAADVMFMILLGDVLVHVRV